MRLRSALLLALLASAGCEAVDELLGRGGSNVDTLRLESIALTSDHPLDPAQPGGAAVATNGSLVRFIATGTFVNVKDSGDTRDQDISSAVVWTSSNPAFALPGADGRVAIGVTTGSATITATTPAAGEVPALTSNAITLTAQ